MVQLQTNTLATSQVTTLRPVLQQQSSCPQISQVCL